MDIKKIQKQLADFANERDWDQFHNPKNLAMALSVEASELVEIFQWLTPKQSEEIMVFGDGEHVKEEMADIMIYLMRMADKLDIDLESAVNDKIVKNSEKYPVDLSKGNAKKSTSFNSETKKPLEEKGSEAESSKANKKKLRRHDVRNAVVKFCKAYGRRLDIGNILEYSKHEQDERGQDYWIGYKLVDHKGEECGEISAGYIYGGTGAYAEIWVNEQIIETDSSKVDYYSHHDKEKNEQPKELKTLLIRLAERAASQIIKK
jgi:dCTP diphosphatase